MNAYRPSLSALLWLLLMLAVTALGSRLLTQDWLETKFLALLPAAEQRPDIALAMERHQQALNGKIVWLAGSDSAQAALAQAERLATKFRQSGLFATVTLKQSGQDYGERYRRLFPYRYQLPDAQTRRILEQAPAELPRQNLELLYSPLGMATADLERDPLLLMSRYFSALNQPVHATLIQDTVVVHDGARWWALLQTELLDANLRLDKLNALQTLVDSAKAEARAAGGTLLATGMPLFTAFGAASAQQEIATVGLGSGLGIAVLLLLTFRSPRPLLLSTLAISSGLWAALVASVWAFGKIHIITLVFGASLIGVADDYAIHFFCAGFGVKNWQPRLGLRHILPGLTIGLATNLLSYAGLAWSPFPGLREVALFSAVGLLAAWLTVVLLFPLLLTGFRPRHDPLLLKIARYWQQRWPVWLIKNRRWLLPPALIFLCGGVWQLTPRDDVRLLQQPPAELLQATDKITHLLNINPENQFFWVNGPNLAAWHHNEQRLLQRLALLKQQNQLGFYQGLSDDWPDHDRQRENYQLLKRGLYASGLVSQYMEQLGFSKQAARAELQRFASAQDRTLTLDDWLATADDGRKQLWQGCDSKGCSAKVTLFGIADVQALKALARLPGVTWVDQAGQLSEVFARCRVQAGGLLVAAYLLVFVGLWGRFGWRDALRISSVPTLSAMAVLAALGWFDQLFSLFNLFALLLVLGIAVDDAVFFFMSERAEHGGHRVNTSLAVTLSTLTTLLAFGLLTVSATEIVHAFGLTVAVGILTALVVAPLIGVRR